MMSIQVTWVFQQKKFDKIYCFFIADMKVIFYKTLNKIVLLLLSLLLTLLSGGNFTLKILAVLPKISSLNAPT